LADAIDDWNGHEHPAGSNELLVSYQPHTNKTTIPFNRAPERALNGQAVVPRLQGDDYKHWFWIRVCRL
jgi:hypothetical protein